MHESDDSPRTNPERDAGGADNLDATANAANAATAETATAGSTETASVTTKGIGSFFSRHRTASLVTAGALIFALAGTGAVVAGASTSNVDSPSVATAATATPTPTETTDPARPVPGTETTASHLRTCSVAELATDSRLGSFQAQVVNANTGEVLFDRGGTTPSRTASVLKVLTSAAALSVLGPDHRATTTVVKGAEAGTVVLVGGGDITLTRLPTGQESAYAGAAHLDTLAIQTIAAWNADPANAGEPITKLVLDSSLFGDPAWEDSWNTKELYDGYMPPITALQVDGDRDSPTRNTSSRSDDPIGRAGEAFADELGGDVTVSVA